MTDYLQLSRPPLREALIHFRFATPLPPDVIAKLKDETFDNYRASLPIRSGHFKFQIGPEAAEGAVTKNELDGWRYDLKEGSRVLQVQRAALTYSVLRDYTNWGDFKASASKIWGQFCDLAENITVSIVALRYINVIKIPFGADFDDYLRAGPRIPPQAPQLLGGFVHSVKIPFSDAEATAIVTQVLEPPSETGMPVVLDIEIQSHVQLEEHSKEIWTRLDKLRNIKNLLFFSSLTERALELFQ